MNNASEITADLPGAEPSNSRQAATPTRPFYWSVRRELWENRSIYLAPLIAAGVVLFGFGITAYDLPRRRLNALALESARQRAAIELPYDAAAMMIMFTAFIVGVFYCLDALYGERRDRSVLFWKSLPVSDRTSVLSKFFVPMAILPAVTFAVAILTQFVMLLISTAVLAPSGLAGTTWRLLPWGQMSVILLWGLVTTTAWYAPLFGWLLLVSSWARRATFLWAFLPWLAICGIEKIAFNTSYFAQMLRARGTSFEHAFVVVSYPKNSHVPLVDRLIQLDPIKFLTSPGLWIGLILAAVFLAGAIQLRRDRGPL